MINNNRELAPAALLCARQGDRGHELYSAIARMAQESGSEIWSFLKSRSLDGAYEQAHRDLMTWAGQGIGTLVLGEGSYPELLTSIFKPPLILFVRGSGSSQGSFSNSFAIVGSRRADLEGCQMAETFAGRLCAQGACVISGLAIGVDSAAHNGALSVESKFPTVAILGSGLNRLYPAVNRRLAERILEGGGLVMSQFEPDEPPYPVNFLKRNRIIAGMSLGTLVIQAGARSGSLVTARFALEEGRDVFVIPGSIRDERYRGSHELIKQGAYLVTEVTDIAGATPAFQKTQSSSRHSDRPRAESTSLERAILEKVSKSGSIHHNELQRAMQGSSDLHTRLLELELSGILCRLPGNYWSLSR